MSPRIQEATIRQRELLVSHPVKNHQAVAGGASIPLMCGDPLHHFAQTPFPSAPVATDNAGVRSETVRRSEAQQATVGRKSRILLAWGLTLAGVCLVGASLALAAVGLPIPVYSGLTALSVIATPLLILGGLICARNPQVRLGRILLGLGVVGSVQLVCGEDATYSVLGHAGQLFATGATAWLSSIAQVVLVVGLIVIILLFPTGRVLSRRWRPVAWALGVGFIGVLAATAFGGPTFNSNLDFVRNPLYVAHPPPTLNALVSMLTVALVVGLIGSIAQLIVRLRGSKGDERQQLKWFAYAGIMAPLVIVAVSGPLSNVAPVLGNIVWTLGPLSLVAAVGIGVLKYRLYDIDVVINKTVVFGALAAFITAVYVAIVVGIGAAIGHDSRPNLGLSLLATGVVAVAFQPIRERVQRFANHLVYGRRATPYEVLSEFSSRMAGSYESEDVLPRMSRILGEGTGAGSTRVWLKVGDELRAEAMWPDSEEPPAIPMEDEVLPPVPDASLVLPVRHRGDLLGALSLTKRPGERLTPTETKLASDLASGAGLVLRNVRLTEELLARVEELPGIASAPRGRAGRRAPPDRAQHPRRRSAAARGSGGEATSRCLIGGEGRGEGVAGPRRAPGGDDRGLGEPARPRARHLPAASRRQGPGGGFGLPGP